MISQKVFQTHEASQTIAISHTPGFMSFFWSFSNLKTYTHEIGHILNLEHTYEINGNGGFSIPKFQTLNFMDYSNIKNMFYYAQWSSCY
jgi:hypothetical protein